MAALKYWDGTKWQTLASAVQDSLEWIDLAPTGNLALTALAATVMPFTVVKGGSGITVSGSGQMVIQKAGVYHVTTNVGLGAGLTGYVIVEIRQWRGGTSIQTRQSVPYSAASSWDTGNVVGTFDAQVGDIFEVAVTAQTANQTIEAARSQFTAFRLSGPGTVQALNAASVALSIDGPYTSTLPGPTTGTAFTTPAGVLRGICTAQGYVIAAGDNLRFDIYLDGVNIGSMFSQMSNAAGVRINPHAEAISVTVTAGTHYLAYRLISGQSSNPVADFGSFFGIVTSASGQLTDAATVLTLTKNGEQALPANVWNTVTPWSVQHAYPTWAPENTGEFTIPADGYYRMDFTWMGATAIANVLIAARFQINGVVVAQQNLTTGSLESHTAVSTWWEGNLRAGDKIKFDAHKSIGAAGTLLAGGYTSGYAPGNNITRATIRKIYSGGIPASQGVPDTPWTAVTFQNGWTNYDPANWSLGQYRRIGGITYLRGLVKPGTVAFNVPIFYLPPGFRISANAHIATMQGGTFGTLNVWPDGRVCANVASSTYYTLDGVSFPAEL
jgi:hypothetical protein